MADLPRTLSANSSLALRGLIAAKPMSGSANICSSMSSQPVASTKASVSANTVMSNRDLLNTKLKNAGSALPPATRGWARSSTYTLGTEFWMTAAAWSRSSLVSSIVTTV